MHCIIQFDISKFNVWINSDLMFCVRFFSQNYDKINIALSKFISNSSPTKDLSITALIYNFKNVHWFVTSSQLMQYLSISFAKKEKPTSVHSKELIWLSAISMFKKRQSFKNADVRSSLFKKIIYLFSVWFLDFLMRKILITVCIICGCGIII